MDTSPKIPLSFWERTFSAFFHLFPPYQRKSLLDLAIREEYATSIHFAFNQTLSLLTKFTLQTKNFFML